MNRTSRIHGLKVLRGGEQGVLLFWGASLQAWIPTEANELFWDDTNKRLGIKNTTPTSTLDVTGTVTMTRVLAGGVKE